MNGISVPFLSVEELPQAILRIHCRRTSSFAWLGHLLAGGGGNGGDDGGGWLLLLDDVWVK